MHWATDARLLLCRHYDDWWVDSFFPFMKASPKLPFTVSGYKVWWVRWHRFNMGLWDHAYARFRPSKCIKFGGIALHSSRDGYYCEEFLPAHLKIIWSAGYIPWLTATPHWPPSLPYFVIKWLAASPPPPRLRPGNPDDLHIPTPIWSLPTALHNNLRNELYFATKGEFFKKKFKGHAKCHAMPED